MRIYKTPKKESEPERCSIVYSVSRGAYSLRAKSKDIGLIVINKDEFLKTMADDDEALVEEIKKEFNGEYDNVTVSTYAEDRDLTGKDQFFATIADEKPCNELPYGVFSVVVSHGAVYFKPVTQPTSPVKILTIIDFKQIVLDFFNEKKVNRKHKKGILAYGVPGNGKSSQIMRLYDLATEENKIRILFIQKNVSLEDIREARDILGDDNTIFIFEEITERLGRHGADELLTFLDGEDSWENSITIATTNNPEELPENIIDRPGRFDTFIEFKGPTDAQVQQLADLYGYTKDVGFLFKKSLSFDYATFIINKALSLDMEIEACFKQEKEHRKQLSVTFKGKMGIGQ